MAKKKSGKKKSAKKEVVDIDEEQANIPNAVQEPLDPATLSIHLRAAAAFRVFDTDGSNMIDVRELGTVVHSLGLVPSQAELQELIVECEDENDAGFVKYEKFEPMITRIVQEKRFLCSDEETLLRAFKMLDTENEGNLTEENITQILTTEGEPLNADEMEEFLTSAKALDRDVVYYDEHVPYLVVPTEN